MNTLQKLEQQLENAMLRHLELDTLQDNIENDEAYRADLIEELDAVEILISKLNKMIDRAENAK